MIYRLNWIFSKGVWSGVCTQHVWADGDDWLNPVPTPQQVADEVSGHLTTEFRAMLANTYTLERLDVVTVTDPGDPGQVPQQGSHAINSSGSRSPTNDDLPPRIGGLQKWQTGLGGKNFKGRMYTPPIESTTELDHDLIKNLGPYADAMGAFGAKVVLANLSGGGGWSTLWTDTWHGFFVVYSPTRHKANVEPFYAKITGSSSTRRPAYLSSRDS